VPGTIISGILFVACVGLYLFVDRIDSEIHKGRPRARSGTRVREAR
jgi:hypothetical protein